MTTSPLPAASYLAFLRADLTRLDELLSGVRERAWRSPVPACPGWDLAKLVRHLGGVHRMVVGAVEAQEPSRSDDHDPGPALADADLPAWLHEGGQRLLGLLDADGDAPAWSFVRADQTLGFWQRRQAQEHLIHRVDAEAALAVPSELPADLAADGIAELIDVMLPLRAKAVTLPPYAVRLRATDTWDEWLLGGGPIAGGASGTAADLLLALWGRRDPKAVLRSDGDAEAVRRVLALSLAP